MAYWDKISRPNVSPKYDLGFDFWWFDPDKARNIGEVSPTENKIKKKDNSIYYLLFFFLLFILWRMKRKNS